MTEVKLEQEFVRLEVISKLYDIPLSTLRRWCAEWRFPVYKISSRIRVSLKEFADWWSEHHVKGGGK